MKLQGLRILMCHTRYQVVGGEDHSARAEAALLSDAGAEVEQYELSNDAIPDQAGLSMGLRTIWSVESFREVRKRLRAGRHHLMHVQNFFPLLSPAVFYAAHSLGVPTLAALRNYRLACVNALFFREGSVCEDCLGHSPIAGIRHRCYRNSALASGAVASMLMFHRGLQTWQRMVDLFVTPSEFAARKLRAAGLPGEKVVVKPNFVDPDPGPASGGGGFGLYAGRLSEEKGIGTLLEAWRKTSSTIPLRIAGTGPLEGVVQEAAASSTAIDFLGYRPPHTILELMGKAEFVIVPSEWYETFGRVVAEAFAVGTPVIASAIGPLAEMVEPGKNGLLVPPGDHEALASVVDDLWSNPELLAPLRGGARSTYERQYTAEANVHHFERIYEQTLATRNG